jgi:transcriptional regulator with XRE-family HTH domain
MAAGLSQSAMASALGCSASLLWRIEDGRVAVTVERLAQMAAVLGMELSVGLHPGGDPLRDKGHQALLNRFRSLLSDAWQVTAETPLPGPGEVRAWDLLLRTPGQLVGVEGETRIRDMQALVRRIRQRERDGRVGCIVVVLADSATNRRMVGELRVALGDGWSSPPRPVFAALRRGRPLPGAGVVLV